MTGPAQHHAATPGTLGVAGEAGYDALAELFLGQDPADHDQADDSSKTRSALAPTDPAAARITAPSSPRLATPPATIDIELLLTGHLPIHGSPWPAQYARAISEQLARPVAMLRLRQQQCSVELFGLPPGNNPAISAADLPSAIQSAASVADRWIVMCNEPEARHLADNPGVSQATLLSGANEAAVVAAYRTVKVLVSRDSGNAPPSLRLGIAVVGASDDEAANVVERIAEACSAFLGRSVELVSVVSKLKPTGAAVVYRGSAEIPLEEAARLILQPRTTPAAPAQPAPNTRTKSPAKPAHSEPKTATNPAPSEPAAPHAHEPTLYRHVAGLVPLAVRCPEDHSVELAGDRDGSLHVLISADPHAERAVERLVAATAWAKRHLELIAMAAANVLPIDTRRAPVAHVFTPTPKAVRHLLDADVKLHALAPVTIDHRTAWCCLELN